jgi:hypothetical protein
VFELAKTIENLAASNLFPKGSFPTGILLCQWPAS